MLQSFDIPVMIEYSSYEQHPLGKVEWVKFFGALTGKEAKAEEAFAEQTEILEEVESGEKTGKTIAFFYVTSNGLIQVRQSIVPPFTLTRTDLMLDFHILLDLL